MRYEMKEYIEKYIEMWKKERGTFPTICYDEDINTELYIGEANEEGYIEWNYKDRISDIDFSKLENMYNICLHPDIKEYYSSFLFMELQGFFKGKSIYLDGVYDDEEILENLVDMFESNNNGRIEIGMMDPESLPIFFENESGNIIIYDYERNTKKILCSSFSELFSEMVPVKSEK